MEEICLNEILYEDLCSNRKINTNLFLEYWKKENYIVFGKGLKFIERFGNLKIKITTQKEHIIYSIITNLCECKINKMSLYAYSNFIERNIMCVGFITGRNERLLLDEDGNFYISFEEDIAYIGTCFYEVLNNIVNNNFSQLKWNEIEDF